MCACGSVAKVSAPPGPANMLEQPMATTFTPAGTAFFTLENGILTAVRGEPVNFIATHSTYGDFFLTVEYRIEPSTNSGIFIRCENADSFSPQTCYEVNIWDDHPVPEFRTGSIVSLAAPLTTVHSRDRWNHLSVRAEGARITVKVNGIVTADISDKTHDSGYIALQNGGNNKVVQFKNLTIKEL